MSSNKVNPVSRQEGLVEEKTSSYLSAFQACKLILSIALHSGLALIPMAYYNLGDYARLTIGVGSSFEVGLFNADLSQKQAIPAFDKDAENTDGYKWLLGTFPFISFIGVTFYPFLFYVYLGPKFFPWRHMTMHIVFVYILITAGACSRSHRIAGFVLYSYIFFSIIMCALSLRFGLPKDSKAHSVLLKYTLPIWLVYILYGQSSQHAWTLKNGVWIDFIILIPVMKEATRFLSLRCAWYFLSEKSVIGSGVEPSRMNSWGFFFWVQCLSAIYIRFQVINIEDRDLAWSVVIYQGLIEIFLRLTMRWRDTAAKAGIAKAKSLKKILAKPGMTRKGTKGQKTVLVDIHSSELGIISREEAEKNFYSLVILAEMIAEYVGIIGATASLWFWADHVLNKRFPAYLNLGPPAFNGNSDWTPFFISMLQQLIMELFVDSICVWYETRYRGFDLARAWHAQPLKPFLAILCASAWYATVISSGMVALSSPIYFCNGETNFCDCPQVLEAKNLFKAYCDYMYQDGRSPSNSSSDKTFG